MGKNEGKKISLTTFILSLIIMALICGILIYLIWTGAIGNKNTENEISTLKEENTKTESQTPKTTQVDNAKTEEVTNKEKEEIEKYIEKIYPISPCDSAKDYFEEFSSIENANQMWIWSTTLRECAEDKRDDDYYNSNINEINETAKKLYGKTVGELPIDKLDELLITKNGNMYNYIGNHLSGEDSTDYRILSIKKENSLFKVELVQYSIHHWTDGIWISRVAGKGKLKDISEGIENVDTSEVDKSINDYIDNNIDKLDKVELTIEYDKDNMQYHVISIADK